MVKFLVSFLVISLPHPKILPALLLRFDRTPTMGVRAPVTQSKATAELLFCSSIRWKR